MFSILTTTLQEYQNAGKLKFFIPWDYLNSEVGQYQRNLSWYDTKMNPVQGSHMPYMEEMTMVDRIIGTPESENEGDKINSIIFIILEFLAEHNLRCLSA